MSHSKQPRSQGKRKDGKNRPRGGAESSIGDPFALSEERLVSLDLESGFNQRRDYSEACRELSLLLRLCYSLAPKPVQSHLYSLAQQAIANLPCMDGALHRSAARQLIQACQAALPRQRKQAVTAEYKRLCVMLARAEKKSESAVEEESEEEEGGEEQQQQEANDSTGSSTKQGFQPLNFERSSSMPPCIPTSQACSLTSYPPSLPPLRSDILHLLFSHLDPFSLARASAVCSHWRDIAAACLVSVPAADARESRSGKGRSGGEVQERQRPLWREFVSRCAQGSSLSSLQSNRVLVLLERKKELEPVAGAAWLVVLLLELEGRVKMQQHVWKLAGTAKVVASLSDEFEGEESSDEDGAGVGRTGYHSNASTVSRFWWDFHSNAAIYW
ncbi:unnamed protein product [Closterium sp. Naga37s-1]|nr:unnamed protein product [Closterium sp. Naga37s-1]